MSEVERDAAGYAKGVPASEIPLGEGRTVRVAGHWIALFNVAGEIYALHNACPHQAGPLGSGRLEGTVVTCPIHGWPFDVRTGLSPTNEHQRVARFDVRVENGWVWVRLFPATLP